MSTTVLDRFLDPVTDCLTPAVAERIVGVQVDSQTQTRLDELAEKANLGQLTEQEREEYAEYVEGMDLVGIWYNSIVVPWTLPCITWLISASPQGTVPDPPSPNCKRTS